MYRHRESTEQNETVGQCRWIGSVRAPLPPGWHFAKAKASSRYREAGLSGMGANSGILVGVYLFIPVRLCGRRGSCRCSAESE